MPRNACVECGGNGKCSECVGTGTNVHLNDAEPKCRNCSGTGTCPKCNGTGRAFVIQPEIQDLGLDKL
jgi:hypothetical protein